MTTIQHTAFARRNCDGLALTRPTRFDVAGIRFFDGENGAAGAGDAAAQAAAAQAAAAAANANANKDGAAKPPWGDDPTKFDPDKAWNLIQNVKGDLAQEKAKRDTAIADAVAAAEKNILGNIAKALGGGEQVETDPAKLQASVADLTSKVGEKDTALTAAAAQVKAGQVALQVAILGAPLGANIPLLLTNEQFKTAIASVEPTDQAAITAEITKALQANAALKQPPARSGAGDHTGPTVETLESQLKAAEEAKDFSATIRLKRAIAAARRAQGA
ncbi:hypothetical protein GCM10009775_04620 [Microbacterium aoyamense]|uniref:Scaffolding protein n=1 Tax=Microbacterium aoyamense TaxID=344166 RepID=A0ABN2PCF3_9MICO|nr:hypothetical protein [Microbacterium aoyamense]